MIKLVILVIYKQYYNIPDRIEYKVYKPLGIVDCMYNFLVLQCRALTSNMSVCLEPHNDLALMSVFYDLLALNMEV